MLEVLDYLENIPQDGKIESWEDPFRDSEVVVSQDFCDIDELEGHSAWAVQNFLERDIDREPCYSDASIEQRAEYMKDFHDNFNELSGYSGNLHFSDKMGAYDLGAFNPTTKRIDLNADLLHDSNPEQLMETILHESRHAYQDYAINNPKKVSVDADTISVWKNNFEHYITPELDYEAYFNQPIEADANDFAERMYEQGTNRLT